MRPIRKVISSYFAAYDIIFLARNSNSLIFSSSCYVSVCVKYGIYFRCFADDIYVNEFLFRWQLRYFHDKISLVFVVFLHFFTVFCLFSQPLFCQVVQSNSHSAKTATNVFLKFIVLLCPFFFCFQSVFSPLFSRCFFPALYNNLYTKNTLNVVTCVPLPGNRRQKNSVHCGVIIHAL